MLVSTKEGSLAWALPHRAIKTGKHRKTPDTEGPMRKYRIGDPWTEAYLLRAEERMSEAHTFAARRALLRDARPARRPARAWLGSVLLAAGHRLLRTAPGPWCRRRIAAVTPLAEVLG